MNRAASDAVLAAEQARAATLVARDPAALAAWLHSDLLYVHATGVRHDRERLLQFVAEGPRFLSVDLIGPVVEVHDDVALVTGELFMSLQRKGETATTAARTWVSAVWLLGSAGWQLRLFQSTRQEPAHG